MAHFKRARPGREPGSVPGLDQCLFTLSGPVTAPTRPSTLPPFVFNGDVPTSQCNLRHFRANTRLSALIHEWAEHGDLFTIQIDRAEHRQCGPSPVDPGRPPLGGPGPHDFWVSRARSEAFTLHQTGLGTVPSPVKCYSVNGA